MNSHYDIVIAGGGLVGASLAAALAETRLSIAVIEPHQWDDSQQASYDERTVALTWSARQIYTAMGLWQQIEVEGATAIHDIHVSNRGHFGMTHLGRKDVGTAALGYVVPTRTLGRVLNQKISNSSNVDLICHSEVSDSEIGTSGIDISILQNNELKHCHAALLVIADGGRSGLTDDFESNQSDYAQQAIVTIVETDQPHNNLAYERFTDEGPIALLPFSDRRYAVVWTSMPAQFDARMNMDSSSFVNALQLAFGDRAGNLSHPTPRKSYPLQRSHLHLPAKDRKVVIGNAAHTVHPVAGQGFNLGLRDVACLAETVFDLHQLGKDPGSNESLTRYMDNRKRDTAMVNYFTDGLIRIFSSEIPGAALTRNTGLKIIEMLPTAKRLLLKRTMGLAKNKSRLAMGQPLERRHSNHNQ